MEQMHNINIIAELLCQCMVKEWIDNTDYYQGFVTTDITAVAYQYQTSGQFTGDLGDLMVLTLVNVLHMPITIFTSVVNMPVICITPTMQVADSAQPFLLTFIQEGPGHYDYAVMGQSTASSGQQKTDTGKQKSQRWTCGRKIGFSAKACFTSRCPCARAKKQCNSLCRCKDCTNPHGIRPPPSKTRRRAFYDTQRQPLCGHPTDLFMQKKGESSLHGHLTLLEVMVLKALAVYFILHGLAITTDNILYAYTQVLRLAQLTDIVDFTLSNLDKEKIKKFLQKLYITMELLKSLLNNG